MKEDDPYRGRLKMGYCYRKHDEKYATKIRRAIAPSNLIKTINFITVMGFPGLIYLKVLFS